MAKRNIYIIFSLILFIASFLRLFKLGEIPVSLNWDEAAIGWNATSIWKVRLDEYGTRLPLTFKSFGDYKAPFLIYATAPFVGILGAEPWAIRLPSALSGIAAVIIIYFLAREICKYLKLSSSQTELFSFVAMFLLAISPWNLMYSRAAFEANIAQTQILFGLWMFFIALRNPWFYLPSGIGLISSLYTYHSPKIFLIIFLPILFILFRNELFSSFKKHYIIISLTAIILVGISIPIIKENLFGMGADRFGTSVFFDNMGEPRPFNFELFKDVVTNFNAQIQPSFYIKGNSLNFRNNLKTSGLMPVVQWVFFVIGLIYLFTRKNHKISWFLLGWYVCGITPGALGRGMEVPHAIRSFNALPAIILTASYATIIIKTKAQKISTTTLNNKRVVISLISIVLLSFIIQYGQYLKEYYQEFPKYSARDWQYGYQQAAQIAQQQENSVEKVIISTQYGQPYIFTYLFQKRDPMGVLWGSMRKYSFQDLKWDGEKINPNRLIIGTPEEIPATLPAEHAELVSDIFFPDGTVAFRVVKTK